MSDKVSPRKRRKATSSEKRAAHWVANHERQAIIGGRSRGEQTPVLAGALTVRRAVLDSTEGGIFNRPDILDLLAANHGADVVRSIGTSLISPLEGKRLIDPRQGNFAQVKSALEEIVDAFPATQEGFAGRALITGSPYKGSGPQFIGYGFDKDLRGEINEERAQLATQGNGNYMRLNATPHVTLFVTTDRELAGELKEQLNELRNPGIPIELGRAEVVPIMHTRHFSA